LTIQSILLLSPAKEFAWATPGVGAILFWWLVYPAKSEFHLLPQYSTQNQHLKLCRSLGL
jgi:hypothetical protein